MIDKLIQGHIIPWCYFGCKALGMIALAILLSLYYFQNNLLYMPKPTGFPPTPDENPPGYKAPSEWNTQGQMIGKRGAAGDPIEFEDKFVETPDGMKIHTWLLLHKEGKVVPTLIYFHGNAGNMGFRIQNAAEMFGRIGINILMMDYRGYGMRPNQLMKFLTMVLQVKVLAHRMKKV
jgi:hypothetical protein